MKIIITSKNYNASERLKDAVESKFEKLDKYFSKDIVANVTVTGEKGDRYRMEATINAVGTLFRAEERAGDPYTCLDKIIDKLASQMSRFKTKLQRKYKDQKHVVLSELPDYTEPEQELKVVRTKKFELVPMAAEEAVMQMELLEHNFFVFLNMDTDSVNVVYKRANGDYGLLETTY